MNLPKYLLLMALRMAFLALLAVELACSFCVVLISHLFSLLLQYN